jgi:hypothetical protein
MTNIEKAYSLIEAFQEAFHAGQVELAEQLYSQLPASARRPNAFYICRALACTTELERRELAETVAAEWEAAQEERREDESTL